MEKKILPICLILLSFGVAFAEDAQKILEAARLNPVYQESHLRAQLRGPGGVTPLTIQSGGGQIVYRFENPDQQVILRPQPDAVELWEVPAGETEAKPVATERLGEVLRGAGVTFEDLALGFLYWPNPKLLGEEMIRTRRCWKIELQAPYGKSHYGAVRVWIDKQTGAIMRMEGYNRDGRPFKRFEVLSVGKQDGEWMLKTMRIETIDPESRRTRLRVWLEVLGSGKE